MLPEPLVTRLDGVERLGSIVNRRLACQHDRVWRLPSNQTNHEEESDHYVEAGGGVLMIAGLFTWFVAPVVLVVSTIGAISVFKAVYIEKRDLNCACVGGGSSVPLGVISLTENLMMMAMASWMMVKAA